MAPADHRILARALMAGLIVLAVGLTGCGRKAGLDPPPSAGVATTNAAPDTTVQKPDRPFFLDWLL